jgi:arylsulfatase A
LLSCKKETFKEEILKDELYNASSLVSTKPNIILILGDDIGYEIPTCNGGQTYSTPNIDRLAQQGMRFTRCYASPLCSPSRFMLQTGKYNFRNYFKWGDLGTSQKTLGNLMKRGGYQTCMVGKWQLGGTDTTIKNFGYDNYSLSATRTVLSEEDAPYSRYKNPTIYQDGKYLPQSLVQNKYSEDFFSNYLSTFITTNKDKPFFAVYSLALAHREFCPTPLDPEFAAWDPTLKISDKSFFPSMIYYMDRKIGQIMRKLRDLNIENNTIVIFTGDNGTPGNPDGIYSLFQGRLIPGGKGTTKEYGTHVPLIVKWPGKISSNTINNNLIDFTDFFPTLANLASVSIPSTYGIIDGEAFSSQLLGKVSTPRKWIFNHFNPHPDRSSGSKRWVQNAEYKLYDRSYFYNISKDIKEKRPLVDSLLTQSEKDIKNSFKYVMSTMHN